MVHPKKSQYFDFPPSRSWISLLAGTDDITYTDTVSLDDRGELASPVGEGDRLLRVRALFGAGDALSSSFSSSSSWSDREAERFRLSCCSSSEVLAGVLAELAAADLARFPFPGDVDLDRRVLVFLVGPGGDGAVGKPALSRERS